MSRGSLYALEFLESSFSRSPANDPVWLGKRAGARVVRQTLQNHSGGMDAWIRGGSTQVRWNERVQPSQQTSSPFPPHDEQ
jgi:hypothetical protein